MLKGVKKMRCKTRNRIKRKNKTRKQKIYRPQMFKGGFASQQVINILYSTDLMDSINTALAPIFEILPTFSKDLVYISFGSKLNERTLESEYLDRDHTYMNRVNAGYQMVPFFLCANSHPRENLLCDEKPCKVLNIVIDIFKDGTEESERYITESLTNMSELDAPLDTSNITQFFINISDVTNGISGNAPEKNPFEYLLNQNYLFLGMIADTFCNKMRENEIADKNFMVCNYIKFKHPNPYEEALGNKISETLSTIMNKYEYENSYYEWCGYGQMVFYNCIVLKKYVERIENSFDLKYFDALNISKYQLKIFESWKSDFKKGLTVLKNIYPIKNPYYPFAPSGGYPEEKLNNFCYSVYDLLQ